MRGEKRAVLELGPDELRSVAGLPFTLAEILVEISGVHNQDGAKHFHLSQ